jgi:DNA-binding response OmpR family regulator
MRPSDSHQPTNPNPRQDAHAPKPHHTTRAVLLVVSPSPARRAALARTLRAGDLACGCASSVDEAAALLDAPKNDPDALAYHAVLIDTPACSDEALSLVRSLGHRHVPAVLVCPALSFDDALAAMRAGAADVVPAEVKPRELLRRLRSALRAHTQPTPTTSTPEPHTMAPGHHASAKPAPAKNHNPLADAADRFGAMIRGELDVETLLRQLLEFILAHAGPTNAAVFLPGSTGDFSLGAYVNYTCPKDTVEVLLDHLANVAAPRLEHTLGTLSLTTEPALRDRLGDGADWLTDHHLLAFTCRDASDPDAECLAVVTLFRDRRTPFDPAAVELASRLGPVFGAQLGRVVRIHHRHLPRDKWSALGDPIDDNPDQGGLAA